TQLAEPGVGVAQIFEHAGKTLRLTNKDQRKVAKVVSNLFARYKPRIEAAAAKGVVDYDATDKLFDAMADRLAPILEKVYIFEFKKITAQTDRVIDTEVYTTSAQEWSNKHTFDQLRGELSDTTIKNLQRMVSKLVQNPALTAADVSAGLFPTFSPYRVAMIATTEVTRAKSAAANQTFDVLTDYGDSVVRRWLTEADEKVCPICGPLDRSLEKTYRKQYSAGPPAHPNCRCDIGVEVKQAEDEAGG
ncbi:phage minor head protein, partial [Streptococcus uberis]